MMVGGLAAAAAGIVKGIKTMPVLPWDDSEPSGGGLAMAGIIAFTTGLVVTITAIDRIKEINNALVLYISNNDSLKISPTIQTNIVSKGYNPGITIQVTF
jgi:hypothetical protein